MKIDNFPRAQIRATLLGDHRIPVHEVDEITDLAIHAVRRASELVFDVCGTARHDVMRCCALGIAISLNAQNFAEMERSFELWARENGHTIEKVELER